ncbi:MAG: winged helix-turn-helix domain-containing protein [Verrucomicrobiia bacterium]
MNHEAFQNLDKVIHEKGRMAIMSLLAVTSEISFTDMRNDLGMTDGNLTTHIKHLQKAGYVGVTKSFRGKRPLTTLSLTTDGRTAFTTYIDTLEQIVQSARSGN